MHALHTSSDPSALLASAHVRELQAAARRDALARLARRCCPSVARRAGRAVLAWLRRGQLGPGHVPCCT